MKKIAVIQSNYLPWKGYFDIIHDVDLFVFYDDVQYTKNDWRNRNKIKTHGGTSWLTVPVGSHLDKLIHEVRISGGNWATKHWKTLNQYYSRAPYFEKYEKFFREVYLEREWEYLSDLNQFLIRTIARDFLGITAEFRDSREYGVSGQKMERLVDLLVKAKAECYVSGPSAKGYIEETAFAQKGIELVFKDYSGYPEYEQFFPPFVHHVSIVDLLFHAGPEAPYYIWGWRES